jgi:hypothetical protein
MRDIAVQPIVRTGIAIVLTILVVIASTFALLHFGHMPFGGDRLANATQLTSPGLASAPQDELARYKQQKLAQRDSTGWVDRNAGIAHIPISDAMDLLVQQGSQGAKP